MLGKIPMEMNEPVPCPCRTLGQGAEQPVQETQVVLRFNSWEWAAWMPPPRERGHFGIGSHGERLAPDRPWCEETHSF